MFTSLRWYLLGLLGLFGAYVALEYYRPKPLDWRPTFINRDKIPYGTYVLYDQLPRLLGTDSVETVRVPAFNWLYDLEPDFDAEASQPRIIPEQPAEGQNTESIASAPESEDPALSDTAASPATEEAGSEAASATEEISEDAESEEEQEDNGGETEDAAFPRANYLFVNSRFEATPTDARALLEFVAQGNDVLIVAERFGSDYRNGRSLLADTLGFRTASADVPTRSGPEGLPVYDSVSIRFTHPALAGPRYRLPGHGATQYLAVDSGRVGHTLATNGRGQAVLVRLNFGKGHFYLGTVPLAFTNFYVLQPATSSFAAAALSYLPARRTAWDEYQKQGRAGDQSLLRLVRSNTALSTAYYLLLAGGLLFVLVEGRRRQRIIPTLPPLPNTTLAFARNVAGLYRQGSNHAAIAEKKVSLFLEYLRTRFHEPSPDLNDDAFRERLSQKAGMPRARLDELLRLVNFARTAPEMNDQQLLKLSKALSDFRQEAGR